MGLAERIWLIAGPTASGKSALALALARRIGAEIVSADSMQLYRGLRVLTAAPSREDEAAAPHHLYGVADPGEAWSVGRWLDAALEAIGGIAARGRRAIVVGGTGLYFRALTQGLAHIPIVPRTARAEAHALYDGLGEAAFRARLSEADPAAAARINPGDRQRLTRAFEVWLATNRALSDWQAATVPPLSHEAWRAMVLEPPREVLYRRCEVRLQHMVEAGALEEVRALMARRLSPSLPAMKALGFGPLAAHLAGEIALADAFALAGAETRRFAKRQLTWLRNQTPGWPRITVAEAAEQWAAAQSLLGEP